MLQNSAKIYATPSTRRDKPPSKIKVFCRLKPLYDHEKAMNFTIHNDRTQLMIQHAKQQSCFKFNHIFTSESQEEFVDSICEPTPPNGSLIFSYGITNAGKTHSILGSEKEPGILPSLLKSLGGKSKLTAVELHNDEFYSLFTKQRVYPKQKLGYYRFEEVEEINQENMKKKIKHILKNRTQTETEANANSSRSHAIFRIENKEKAICVVDLAGSQRINKPTNETNNINKSLLSLGRCLKVLSASGNVQVVPYRQSKLTRVLMEYFIHLKITMILNIQPSERLYHENINVLNYSSLASGIRFKKTRREVSPQNFLQILKKIKLENTFKQFQSSQELFDLYLEETFRLEKQLDQAKLERMKMEIYRSPIRPEDLIEKKEVLELKKEEKKEVKKEVQTEEKTEQKTEEIKFEKKEEKREEKKKEKKKAKCEPKNTPLRTPLKYRLRGAKKNKKKAI